MKMLSSVRLTHNQKRVLSKIISAPTPKIAAEEISQGSNLSAATTMLTDLGLIELTLDDHATLTDKGRDIAQEENLADSEGNLTPDGTWYAGTDSFGDKSVDISTAPTPSTPDTMTPLTMSHMYSSLDKTLLRELLSTRVPTFRQP